ncbi:MAG: PIG-L family deacetylase, partial [Candidatus Omnitrophica bacterium]|nr:PIG-L family deacetylase [Candidatus Omnitrophota bacterium]
MSIYKITKFLFASFLLLVLPQLVWAQDVDSKPFAPFISSDRILIVSPHPDDEAIATGGVISRAVKAGIPLKIVYLTNGDNNEPAFMIYEKRLVVKQKAVLMMGELRCHESINGMQALGVKRDQLVFLGYPDWGTEDIFKAFWSERKPFKTGLTRVNHVPYEDALSAGSPYVGDSILKDFKQVLTEFKPTKIFVSNQLDSQRDHRAAFLFLQVALWDLEESIPRPDVYGYVVHSAYKWPTPRGYHPDQELTPPKNMSDENMTWYSSPLSADDILRKRQAVTFYRTQIACNPPYLFTFVKLNELFTKVPDIDLTKVKEAVLKSGEALTFSKDDQFVYMKLNSDYWPELSTKIQIYLFGYSKKIAFEVMPKIRLDIGKDDNKVLVYEKDRSIFVPEAIVNMDNKGKILTIKFPLKELQDPDYLLISGMVCSQAVNLSSIKPGLDLITKICLAYIMIGVGLKFIID